MLVCTFWGVQPKHQNGNIFVDIEGFRQCLSKPSYRAPKWALVARLMQKERLKSPQKLLILENQAFGVIWAIWPQLPFFLVILASHSEPGWTRRKKSHLRVCLDQRDRATFVFRRNYTHRKPGKIFYWRGCSKTGNSRSGCHAYPFSALHRAMAGVRSCALRRRRPLAGPEQIFRWCRSRDPALSNARSMMMMN